MSDTDLTRCPTCGTNTGHPDERCPYREPERAWQFTVSKLEPDDGGQRSAMTSEGRGNSC